MTGPPPDRRTPGTSGVAPTLTPSPAAPPSLPSPSVGGGDDPARGLLAAVDDDVAFAGPSVAKTNVVDDDRPTVAEPGVGERVLAFRIDAGEYAARLRDLREIIPVRRWTEVPRAPREFLGVVSHRGAVLPVIDMGAIMGLREPDRSSARPQRILVVGDDDRICGLRVDRVTEVVRVWPSTTERVPANVEPRQGRFLLGRARIASRVLLLVDIGAVLDVLAVAAGLPVRQRAAASR